MGVIIIDTLQRGGSGTSPFPVILEQDSSISYVTVADVTTRDSIPEWKRRSNMQCFVISTGLAYRLGTDLTISGQVWVEIPGVGSGFQLLSEKGQVDGYVPLDGLGKIDAAYINNIYSNDSYTAASEAAMLALTTQTGDIVTRTDSSQIFVKLNNNGPPAVIGDFAELLFPGAVLSVNGLTGAVSITFTSLLAWASNQTEFDAAVTANTTVSGNSGAITINQTDISTLQGEVLALQNATKQITDFDSGVDYVITVDYVVFPEATSGNLELFKCIQSTSNPSPDPTNPAYWERIGDYLTTTEIAALLVLKADLVAGVVPLAQLPPEVFSGTVIVADIAFRDAYTPKNVGLVFYVKDASADPEVTAGAAEYIYKPSDPLADGEGFVLKENPGTDDIDEGSTNLYYTEARVTANSSVAANTAARHAESHTIVSHNDTIATGAELNELTGGGDTALHTHVGGGHIIEDEGTPITQRGTMNFVGDGVTVTDNGKTVVNIPLGAGLLQSVTITNANATDTLAILATTNRIKITLDAALTVDWEPVSITGGVEDKFYEFIFVKEVEQNVNLLLTTNVEFPESATGDPVDGIDPFAANFLNVQIGESASISVRGKASSKLLFNQLTY